MVAWGVIETNLQGTTLVELVESHVSIGHKNMRVLCCVTVTGTDCMVGWLAVCHLDLPTDVKPCSKQNRERPILFGR
jgi:hypothetical protein